MPFIRAGDITVHHQLDGPASAPVVMLANSLGTSLHMWDWQIAALASRRRVLRYDMRGHGLSGTGDGETTSIAQLAGDAVALLDALAIARADVVGLSIGGLVAQRLAAAFPDRVGAVVLCATFNHLGNTEVWNQRIAAVREGGPAALADGTLQRWFTPRMHAERPDVIDGFRNMIARTPRSGYIACAAAVRDADLRDDDAKIRARTLIVSGAQDPGATPAAGEAMRSAIPGARLHVMDDAMHILNVERAAAFNELVGAFLEGS